MLLDSSKWSDAYEMAKRTMRPDEIENLFVSKAETEAENSNFKVAEELFILCDKEDLAISMYKKEKRWDEMIKLGLFSRYFYIITIISVSTRRRRVSKFDIMGIGK